jgi:hypothetical protein
MGSQLEDLLADLLEENVVEADAKKTVSKH